MQQCASLAFIDFSIIYIILLIIIIVIIATIEPEKAKDEKRRLGGNKNSESEISDAKLFLLHSCLCLGVASSPHLRSLPMDDGVLSQAAHPTLDARGKEKEDHRRGH